MLITTGTQDRVIKEVTTGAGITSREGSVISSAILATLWVSSVTSGTLDVVVYTLTDTGKEVQVLAFPTQSGATVNLLLQKSGPVVQRFRVQATYTGIADYEVYIRATDSGGTQDVTILGQPIDVNVVGGDVTVTIVPPSQWQTSQVTATNVSTILIPAAISDRKGILIKNWSTDTDVFIGESAPAANTASGYPLSARDAVALDLTAGSAVYAVTASGTADIRIVQAGT